MTTIELLKSIGYLNGEGSLSFESSVESQKLYELARVNKVASLYVKSLKDRNQITSLDNEWAGRRQFHEDYQQTLKVIDEDFPSAVNYAVVKSTHSFWFDSKDIDIVLFDDSLTSVTQKLSRQGYELIGTSPTSADLRHPETGIQIDIQDEFSLQKLVYLDKTSLRQFVEPLSIGTATVPVVSMPGDLALIVIHSITEQLFILKEFYAAIHALETFSEQQFRNFINVVDENQIGPACGAFFTIVDELCIEAFDHRPPFITEILTRYSESGAERSCLRSKDFKTPHRYTVQTGLETVWRKLWHKPFAVSLCKQIPRLASPSVSYHILSQLLSRRTREHYMHDDPEPTHQ